MKSDKDRGIFGAWARRERVARHWTTADVVRELDKRGVSILEATYRGIEAGPRAPSSEVRRGLAAVFGSPVPNLDTEIEATEPVQLSGLITALEGQTAAINRLVATLEANAGGLPDRIAQELGVLLGLAQPPADADAHEETGETPGSVGTVLPRTG